MVDVIAVFLVLVKCVLIAIGILFLISGADELFIDIFHSIRSLYRRLLVLPKHSPLTEEKLLAQPEKAVAIMIPCWDESAVIRRMLENSVTSINYSNYRIFIGTYPNDPETQREVELARERFSNIQRIVCPKDGPTNKADCLNWIFEGIKVFEQEHGVRYEIFVMHDSEDIVHPLSLKLYNYLIPAKDMVQLPVFPMEPAWHQFTAGTYLDEFAEVHSKDMIVRERLDHSIPSAGVGCAFSRKALETSAAANRNQLFDINSLTEDYDFGLRLKKHGLKQVFVRQAMRRTSTRKSFLGRRREVQVKELIATRAFFPDRFRTAIRQKSRWIVGISLQGWANLGWRGHLSTKYMLFRDRKALFTHQVNMLGYFVVVVVLTSWAVRWLFPESYRFPPLVEAGTWLWYIILINAGLLVVRAFQRARWVRAIYGWQQALLSLPRYAWGNVINFAATMRALYLFSRYLVTGKFIAWDKTGHVFPSEEILKKHRRKLGDLLLERRFIAVSELDAALQRQKESGRPLGAVLLESGLIREDELLQVLGQQLRVTTSEIDPYSTPLELLRLVPRKLAAKYGIYPLSIQGSALVIAADHLPTREQTEAIEQVLGRPVEVWLATRSDVGFAIRRGYQRLESAPGKVRLGQLLLALNLCTEDQLQAALRRQRGLYRRLGEILVAEGYLSAAAFQEHYQRYFDHDRGTLPLGDFLIQAGAIDSSQLARALELQNSQCRHLGDILVEMGTLPRQSLEEIIARAETGDLDGETLDRQLLDQALAGRLDALLRDRT
jgi:adsorption protein B